MFLIQYDGVSVVGHGHWLAIAMDNYKSSPLIVFQLNHREWAVLIIIIIRIFTQDNPSVHCTVINGVLHIELN